MKKKIIQPAPLGFFFVAVILVALGGIFLQQNSVEAAATNVVGLQMADTSSCSGGVGTARYASDVGTWMPWTGDSDNYDPDCVRLYLGNTIPKDLDIRIGIQSRDINTPCGFLWLSKCGDGGGTIVYGPWASESVNSWSGWACDKDCFDGDQWRLMVDTRPWYGTSVTDFKLGIQVGDVGDIWGGGGGCTAQIGITRYSASSTAGVGWTSWAADNDDNGDYNCTRINLISTNALNDPTATLTGTSSVPYGNSINIPWDVEYINTTTGCTLTGRNASNVVIDPARTIKVNGTGATTSIAITVPTTYTLFCNGLKVGTTASATKTITVITQPATLAFSMAPTSGLFPGSTTVATISAKNAAICTLVGKDTSGAIIDSGYSFTPPPPSAIGPGPDPSVFVQTFTSNGTFSVPSDGPITSVEVLVVAGGAGGGTATDRTGGGGGGGGVLYNASYAVTPGQQIAYTVGAGGGASASGGNSTFGTLTAIGGGRGGRINAVSQSGGSGGGAYHNPSDSGKAGTAGQGYAGGNGYDSGVSIFTAAGGGGGGGAGASGTVAGGGNGGVGYTSSISGASVVYGSGGGGGSQRTSGGTLPAGVGGSGAGNGGAGTASGAVSGTAGTANRGGGGGGGATGGAGGTGGSGVVIVKYSYVPEVYITRTISDPNPTSWTVPSDWSSENTIEVIGGGGGGSNGVSGRGGAGGGGYSKITNTAALTQGSTVTVAVGAGGAASANGGDTYVCSSTSNCGSIVGSSVIVGAKGGSAGATGNAAGGQSSAGVGSLKYSGGTGGNADSSGGAGGGGGAGPNGNGGSGGYTSRQEGSGGGGNGGGGNGGSANSVGGCWAGCGGPGGSRYGGGGGGSYGDGGPGGNGSTGGGGGGADDDNNNERGGHGGHGIDLNGSIGSGGAGGGGGQGGSGNVGGNGGLYGGGGGGGADSNAGGPGGAGVIYITYTPGSGIADNTEAHTSDHIITQTTDYTVSCTGYDTVVVAQTVRVNLSSCSLDGITIANGGSANFYSQSVSPTGHVCSEYGPAVRTCTNGVLGATNSSYIYGACLDQSNITITANTISPSISVRKGTSIALSWDGGNADSCTVTGTDGFSSTEIAATMARTITQKTIYTARCTVGASSKSKTVTVNLIPSIIEQGQVQ
jgi:hypothetical protein